MHICIADLVKMSICFDFSLTGRAGIGSVKALQGN